MPLSATVVLLLVIVNVSVELCPVTTGEVNDLLNVGAPTTVSVAVLLVLPTPPSVEEIGPVVLSFKPAEVALTCTVMVQVAPPPLKVPP